ncbi:hypothetical protein [Flavobacterium tegetincola]|uniref:hypothetical protein n=1 Tax=Flavobacterium tegetincola TaxID=150172 RepID=UPI0003F82F16|nr:hypothetical protein [Flavobacterium tegetincola]
MKKIFLFLAVASTTMFVSCSDDDENSTDKNAATSIVLAANVASIEVGQSVTFTVTDNNALVVTGSSTILANNVEINGATFTPTAAGSYAVKAVHTNSNDVALESNTVTITVTAVPVASNSVIVGTTSYVTDNSILYYLGTTAENNNVFVANAYNVVVDGEDETYPNDTYIYFTSAQVGTTTLTLPTVGAYAFGTDAQSMKAIDANLIVNDDVILATEVTTNASMNLSALVASDAAQTWTYTYSVLMADNTTVKGEFHGDFGFVNQSTPAAKSKMINKVSNAQIKQNLKRVMSLKK